MSDNVSLPHDRERLLREDVVSARVLPLLAVASAIPGVGDVVPDPFEPIRQMIWNVVKGAILVAFAVLLLIVV